MANKIALCLSGFPRNYKDTFSLFKKHVIDPLNPDIFFYGYNQKCGETDKEFLNCFNFLKSKTNGFVDSFIIFHMF